MPEIIPIPNTVDIASVTTDFEKNLFLPATSSIYGKTITIKDITGGASSNSINLYTQGPDRFEDGISCNYVINTGFGYASFFAKSNIWYLLTESIISSGSGSSGSSRRGADNSTYGVSSLSTIVSYGLSSIYDNLVLSTIVSYGLSTVYSPYGLSSLSSITSYSISTFSSIIGESFTTSSIFTTYISSQFAEFSSISTQSFIIGNLEYPLDINIGLTTPSVTINEIDADISYIKTSVGIGREVTDEYILDVTSDGYAKFQSIESRSIDAVRLIGDGSLLSNVWNQGEGFSSLSSVISYGLSSIISSNLIDSIKSLSTIVSYGLSTVALNLQLDSNITSFHASNIGGTGILGTNIQSDNDTYTSAIGKIDSWLYTNIVGNPPAPTFYGKTTSGNKNQGVTLVVWNAPFQTKIGFGDNLKYIPYISSLTIELSNIYVGTFCNIVLGSNYIPFIGSNIEGLLFRLYTTRDLPKLSVLNLINKNILNVPILLTPEDGGGLTLKTYIIDTIDEYRPESTDENIFISDTTIRTISETKYVWLEEPEYIFSARIWYANYSLDPYNILEFSNLTFTNGNIPRQGPDPPHSINICNISDNSITLDIISPTYSVKGTEISPSYINFSNYYIDIERSVLSRRYSDTSVSQYRKYDPLPVKSNYQSNISQIYNFNDLTPDTTYSINIGIDNSFYPYKNDKPAKNSSNLGLCNISITTLLPSAPPTITDIIVESNIGKYQYSGQPIYNTDNIQYDSIYNKYNIHLQFTTNPLGIHTIFNPGSVTEDIISRFAININNNDNNGDTNTDYVYYLSSYFSYNTDTFYTPEQIYDNSIKISGIVRDYYSNDNIRSNFYQVFTPTITVFKLAGSSNPYTFTLFHENILLTSNIKILSPYSNYYIDDINDIPSLAGWTIEEQNTIYISGVKVTGYSNTLSNNIDIQNLARYFYRYNQNLLVATYCNYNINISSNNIYNQRTTLYTTDNGYQSLPLQNTVRIKANISINCNTLYTPASNSAGGFTIYTQLCNLVGESYPSRNSLIYFDAPSENIVRTVINSPNSIGGLRLESHMSGILIMPSSNLINNLPYSNSSNIYTDYNNKTDYRYELPLINGYFRTGANLSNLYDYIHLYCNVSLTGYSNIKNERKIRYATFKYSFENLPKTTVNQLKLEINNSTGFNSNPDGTYNSSVPYLYYYVEKPGVNNSNWIDANKIRDSSFPFNSNDRTGLRKDSITNNSRYLFTIPILPDTPYNVYVRIGLQMSCNINFNYITITPGFNPNPGPVLPEITSFILEDDSLVLNWIKTDFEYGGIINIIPNNTLFSEDHILRRYIPGGADGIIQESQFKDIIYDDITTITTFRDKYDNYDTPYNAILSFTNENGERSTAPYPLSNRQLFNIGSNYLLYGVVFNKVYSASSNSYSNYIQLRSLENIAANIRLYNEKDTYEILKTINTYSGLVNLRVLAGIDTPDTDKINYMLNLTRRFTTSNLAGIVIGNNVFSNLNYIYNSNRSAYVNAGCNGTFLDQFDNRYVSDTNTTLSLMNVYINRLRNGIIADGNWMPPIGFAEGPEFFNYYSIVNRTNNKTLEIFLSNIDFFGLNAKDNIQINVQDMTDRFISYYYNIRYSLDTLNILNTNIWITEVGYSNTFPQEFLNSIINWNIITLYRDKKIPFYWYSLIDTDSDNWGLFSKSLNPKWDLLSVNTDITDVNYVPISIIFDPSNDLYYSSTGEYANWISNYIPPSATPLPLYNAPYFYELQSSLDIINIKSRSNIYSNIYSIITRKREPFFLYEFLQNQSVQFDYGDGFSGYGINDLPGKDLSNWSFIASWSNIKPIINNIFTFSNDLYIYSNSAHSITQESNITFNIINISDQYSSGQETGFYMKAHGSIIITSNIYNNNIDYTKPNMFSISLNNPVPFHVINSSNIYIDNFRSIIPDVISIDVDSNELILSPGVYSNYICGVLCFSGLNSNTFYVGISNIGSYAYVSDLFSGEINGSNLRFNNNLPFYYDQGLEIINSRFSNITYIKATHSFGARLYSASNNFVFSNIIVKNVYNSNNSSNILYYGFQNKNLLFDDPSIEIVNTEKFTYEYDFSDRSAQTNYGQRVESGTILYPDIGTFGSNFNNTCNIFQGKYINEIQLANGFYRTYCNAKFNGASNGYLIYKNFYDPYSRHLNYDNNNNNYQYVTYSWHISPKNINFSNATLYYTFQGDNPYKESPSRLDGIQILFKIVASNETTSLPNNKTTGWLNANALTANLNSNNKTSNGEPCSFNITSEDMNILFPEPYTQYCNVDFKVYIKFGLPSSCNISLLLRNLNINSTLSPFSNDSLLLTLSNNNSLYLGIGASIIPTLGTTFIKFKASNIEGSNIEPSNYTVLSEIKYPNICNYYINYADCAYNSNTALSNVRLWIYASNTYNNRSYEFEKYLDGSTGPQCNFDRPTISNYSNVMNINGSVTTTFTINNSINLNRGTVVWNVSYYNASNNIRCNSRSFSNEPYNEFYSYTNSDMIVESNFYQYYSNTVTLSVTVQSNCWSNSPLSNTSNLTSNYIPISGKYIGITLQSNDTRDVGLIVTRSNGINGRQINIYFRASNNYYNSERTIIEPSIYDFTQNKSIGLNTSQFYRIVNTDCSYNCNATSNNVRLWILASNADRPYETYSNYVEGKTGPQCNFSNPTISNYSNTMDPRGYVITEFTVNNTINRNRGIISWFITYSNAATGINFSSQTFSSNIYTSPFTFTYNNSNNTTPRPNFSDYYSNIVTLYLTVDSNCWRSASNNIATTTIPYVPIDSRSLSLVSINCNTRELGAVLRLTKTLTGNPNIRTFFWASNRYFNSEGTYITPSNYDSALTSNLSNVVGRSNRFTINYAECFYNCNIRNGIVIDSNVALWIFASNTNDPHETYCNYVDGSTGVQCNFSAPTINNYRNVMNIDGSVTTTFTIDNNVNINRGTIVWELEYYNASNRIQCNAGPFSNVNCNYNNSNMLVDNFYQYYSNTVTLKVSVQSNCWLPASNSASNLTSNYIPISGEYIGITLQSNDTRDIGLIVTRSNGIDGRQINIYFRASNNYCNSEGTIIEPSIYDFTQNNSIRPNTSQFYRISNTDCSYNCNATSNNVRLWILASNADRPYETYYTSLEGKTGAQCNFDRPTISNYSNVMNVDGSVTTTFTIDNNVNNNRGTVVWDLKYFNALNNITCNAGPFSNRDFYYSNSDMIVKSNFYQYYSNTVTLSVTVQSNCWSNSPLSNTSNLTSNYIPISGEYIGITLQSNDTRDVGLIVTRSNGINGRQINIYFRASNNYYNSERTIIEPSIYDFTQNDSISPNTSQFYRISNTDCSYNCNATSNNVRLWILASNVNLPNETYSNYIDASTGPQCNLPRPTISNYSNVMNIDGSVTTYATIHNYIPGTISWSIDYSNRENGTLCNISPANNNTNTISFCNYPTMKNNNFYQYYNNIVTLNVSLSKECWTSNSNSIPGPTSNYVKIDSNSISVSIINSNSLYLGARVRLTKSITGNAAIFFKASNMYGTTTITPNNYNFESYNTYNTITEGSNYFITYSDCFFNSNTDSNNVTLWILASNRREPLDDKYYISLEGSTGPQCNFSNPTITGYTNSMTNLGFVNTSCIIDNRINNNRGEIKWFITYSNAATGSNFRSIDFSCNTYNAPFSFIYNNCNNETKRPDFLSYYSNIVTLNLRVESNCWKSGSNNISNTTSNYNAMKATSFTTVLTNNNSLYLGITITQNEEIAAIPAIYFKASNINIDGTTITPSEYIYLSNFTKVGDSVSCNIDFSDCYYNCNIRSNNVALWILASNTNEPRETYCNFVEASTGPQCNFSNPIITGYSNTMDPRGYVITEFTVNNSSNRDRGIINWFITYSNAATGLKFTSQTFSNSNYTSPFDLSYNNSNNPISRPNFSDYYNNIVTLNLRVDSNCWKSGFSNIFTTTIPYVPIDSRSLSLVSINCNTRDLGVVLTLRETLTGNPNIITFFWASNRYCNSEGTIIQPIHDFRLTSNLSNVVDGSNRFTISNTECSYNCNIIGNNIIDSNVALWIFASNTNYPHETYCNYVYGSTGPQCNFSNPTISNYSNTMDPRGYVITEFTVNNSSNRDRGIINWFITYSNAATRCNFTSQTFSNSNYTSPFDLSYNNSNNLISRPNFSDYYNNIVTLNLRVDSNCWIFGFSNIFTTTIPYVPIDSRSLSLVSINCNTRDLGAVLTLRETLTGNPNIITFFWASNRYCNSEGTIIRPSHDSRLTSNLSNVVGQLNRFTISNTECSYNCNIIGNNIIDSNVALWIFASNNNYPHETYCNYVDGSTGPQCNFLNPTITAYTNTMDPTGFPGYIETQFTVNNRINANRGVTKWFITYSNAATRCNFTSPTFSNSNYTAPLTLTYNNSNNLIGRPNFSNYYSNIVTLNLSIVSNCWRSGSSNIFTTTSSYVPIDSRSLSLVSINSNTRNLGAVLTLKETLTGNPDIKIYFRASNLLFNSEGTFIQPNNYNFAPPVNLQNSRNTTRTFNIVNNDCSYNSNTRLSNVRLSILASNANEPRETFTTFVDGSTGPQCNFYIGSNITTGSNIITIVNASVGSGTGTFNLFFRVNNSYCNYKGATNRWRVTLSNNYNNVLNTSSWFTSNFNNCNISEIRYIIIPPANQFLRYFNNTVTVEVEFSSNCWETYSETRRSGTGQFSLTVPPILTINPFNYIRTSNYTTLINFSNYVTISNSISRSLIINTRWTTLADSFSSNNSNYLASNIIPDSDYNISAYYEVRDSNTTNIFRSPVSDEYPFTKYVYTRLVENTFSNSFIFLSNSDRYITLVKADIYNNRNENCNNFFNNSRGNDETAIFMNYTIRSNNPINREERTIGGNGRNYKFGSNITFGNKRFNVITLSIGDTLSSSSKYNKYYIKTYVYYNLFNIVSPGTATVRSFRLNYSNDPTAAFNNNQLELNSEFLVVELSNPSGTACNYRVTFHPIQYNRYPRRWVPSMNRNAIFQDSKLSNIIVYANDGITTYSNTFTSYDTEYEVRVSTDNEFMVGSNITSNDLTTSVMFPYEGQYLMAGGYTFDSLGSTNQYIQAYYYYLNRLQRIMPSARMLGSTDGTPFQGYEFALSLLTRYSSALGNFKLILDCGYRVNAAGLIDDSALTKNIDYLTSIVEMYGTQNIGGIEFGNNIFGEVINSKPSGDQADLITDNYTILRNQLIYLRSSLSEYGHPPPIIYADYNISNILTKSAIPRNSFSNFLNMVDTFGMQQYGEPSLIGLSNDNNVGRKVRDDNSDIGNSDINVYCNAVNTLYNYYNSIIPANIRIILNEFGDGPIQIRKTYQAQRDTGAVLPRYTVYTAIQKWANRVDSSTQPILQFNNSINCNVYDNNYGTNMFIKTANNTGVVLRLNPNVGVYIYDSTFTKFYRYRNSDFIRYSSSNATYPARIGDPGGFTPTITPQSASIFFNPRRTPLPDYNRPSFEDVNKFAAVENNIIILPPTSLTSDMTGYSVFNNNVNNIILTTNDTNNLFYIDYSAPGRSGYFMGDAPGAGTSYILNTLPGSNLENVRFTAVLSRLEALGGPYPIDSTNSEYNCSNELFINSNFGTNRSNGILYLDTIRDMYPSGGRTGFHMIARVWIKISEQLATTLSNTNGANQRYIATLKAYQTSNYMNLNSYCSFMIDTTPKIAPSILNITTSNTSPQYNICGVVCYSGTDTNVISIYASNIGDYSYHLNAVTATIRSDQDSIYRKSYNFSHSFSEFLSYPNRFIEYGRGTNTIFPDRLYVTINTINDTNAYGSLNANITIRNIHNLSRSSNIDYGYNGESFFFDTPSIIVLRNTSDPNYTPSNTYNYGIRVKTTGGTLDFPDNFFDYNHTASLASTSAGYINELQLTKGAYRTYCNARISGSLNGYLDYRNYYGNNNGSEDNYTGLGGPDKRYITLLWHFDIFAIKWYAATFEFNFITAPRYNSINKNFPGLDIHYRIKVITSGSTANSTNWLNANSNSKRIPQTSDGDGTVGGITGGLDYLTVYFPRVNDNYCNVEFNLYLRIGIPNHSNVSFNYVNLYAFESESLKISLL
jgi:hypothetical protein